MPPLRSNLVVREHLIEKLAEGRNKSLISIIGQAGSGKTSLVSQWIMHDALRSIWYSLDETDNEADLFLRYFLTALSDEDDQMAESFAPFLQYREKLNSKEILPYIIQQLDALSYDLFVILDDYHVIANDEIHEVLSRLLRYLPPKMHFIIISRSKIPFSLALLRMRNQLTEIGAPDLKLSSVESERFLTDMIGPELTADQLENLTNYSEGWIGGLQMLAVSLRGRDNMKDFGNFLTNASKMTGTYLIDEVINVQKENVKDFIYKTVLLNRFNADLCSYLTGDKDAGNILEYMQEASLFLVPLDAEGTWYRYHHLFTEALRVRVKGISPNMSFDVNRRAAIWFARHNLLEDAFQHAFATENYDFFTDLLEDHLVQLFERYEIAGARRWISKVPHHMIMQRTLLRLYDCTFKVLSQEMEDLEAVISDIDGQQEEAFKRYKGFKKRLCRNTFYYLKYRLPYYRDPASVDVNRLIERPPQITDEDKLFYGASETVIALCHLYRGNLSEAEKTLDSAKVDILTSKSIFRKVQWLRAVAEVERWKGKLQHVEATVEKAFQILDQGEMKGAPLKSHLYLPLAKVYYLRNDLKKALDYTLTSVRYAEQARHVNEIIPANYQLALTYLAMGEPDKVNACVQKMKVATSGNSPGAAVLKDVYIALLALAMKDIRTAEAWSEKRRLKMDEPFSLQFVLEVIAMAKLLYLQKRYADSIQMIVRIRDQCIERNIMLAVLQADLLYSAALYASDCPDQANDVARGTLVFSEKEGFVRPFVDSWGFIAPVLLELASKPLLGIGHAFFSKILNACGIAADSEIQKRLTERTPMTLSPRELAILQLVAAGYSNKEISQKAFISIPTVKTHISHIFQKLEVKTRVQAVARAGELNLL